MKDRKINKYPLRTDRGTNTEKWGVDKRKKVEKKLLLFSGTGRSGSKTITNWMKNNDIDVMHEATGSVGSSTHFFHSDSDWYPMLPWCPGTAHIGERLSDYEFENHYHIVRNPLTCIPSINKIFPRIDFEFLEDLYMMPVCISSKLNRCMWLYYSINKKLESQVSSRNRVRLENIESLIPLLKKDTGIEISTDTLPHSNKGSGFRKSEAVTWDILYETDKAMCNSIKKMSKRYGYDT